MKKYKIVPYDSDNLAPTLMNIVKKCYSIEGL